MNNHLEKYADLIVNYCLEVQAGESVLIQSTTLAEPLVREVYRKALQAEATVETILSFREQKRLLIKHGTNAALGYVNPAYRNAIYEFDAFVNILAPFNLRENAGTNTNRAQIRSAAFTDISQRYSERTATRSLKRNLCLYPTLANAQEAGEPVAIPLV